MIFLNIIREDFGAAIVWLHDLIFFISIATMLSNFNVFVWLNFSSWLEIEFHIIIFFPYSLRFLRRLIFPDFVNQL